MSRQLATELRAAAGAPVGARSPELRIPSAPIRATSLAPPVRMNPELRAALEAVNRAADLGTSLGERVAMLDRRVEESERTVAALERELADTRDRLRAALDEAGRERARGDDLQRRSNELLEKTQVMLTDASERLHGAEARAEQADADLAYLAQVIVERLGLD